MSCIATSIARGMAGCISAWKFSRTKGRPLAHPADIFGLVFLKISIITMFAYD
jgi:hypothetical protein